MPVHVAAEKPLVIGQKSVIEGPCKTPPRGVVFEDDAQAGYFYAVEFGKSGERRVLDAVHVYDVANVAGDDRRVQVRLVWSLDGNKAALVIDDFTHAVFDFATHRGYSRQSFPGASGRWSTYDHKWSDRALDSLL